MTNKITL